MIMITGDCTPAQTNKTDENSNLAMGLELSYGYVRIMVTVTVEG